MPSRQGLQLPITTPRLILRLPTLRDVDPWLRILSSPPVMRLMAPRGPWTRRLVVEKVRRARLGHRSGTLVELTIEERSTGQVLGRIALKDLDRVRGRGEIAYWLSDSAWGQGFVPEAAHALLRAAFRDLHLHRIDAAVFSYNTRSQAVVRRLGFRREGVLREAFRHEGRWAQEFRYGLLKGELRPRRATATKKPHRRSGSSA